MNFRIEKLIDGKWTEIESKEAIYFPKIVYVVLPKKSNKHTFTISETKEKLTNGQYRVVTSLQPNGKTKFTPYATFSVNNL